MSRIKLLSLALLVLASVTSSASAQQRRAAASSPSRPEITTQLIRATINGKSIRDVPPASGNDRPITNWQFRDDELKEVDILERVPGGNKTAIVINMKTADPVGTIYRPAGFNTSAELPTQLDGRLRLNYEFVTGEWVLLSVENLTMKFSHTQFHRRLPTPSPR